MSERMLHGMEKRSHKERTWHIFLAACLENPEPHLAETRVISPLVWLPSTLCHSTSIHSIQSINPRLEILDSSSHRDECEAEGDVRMK